MRSSSESGDYSADSSDGSATEPGKDREPSKRRCCGFGVGFVARRAFKVFGITVIAITFAVGLIGWPLVAIDSQMFKENLLSVLFLIALLLVILEDHVGVNKAAVMLMVSAAMWTFLAAGFHPHASEQGNQEMHAEMDKSLEEVGRLILFLLPAMAVVESIDHFGGFSVVTRFLMTSTGGRQELLMPMLSLFCFFLSAVIDNLTATIVVLKLLRHCAANDRHVRHTIGGMVVIAANAGGVWSPVGDVTTTMLWLAGNISVGATIKWLFFPSFAACVVPLFGLWLQLRKCSTPTTEMPSEEVAQQHIPEVRKANVLVLIVGISCILMVPVLKMITGLPPYMGMLLALGVLWFVTDTAWFHKLAQVPFEHRYHDEEIQIGTRPRTPAAFAQDPPGSVVEALHSMDLTGLLFFVGVLLAVGALDTSGILDDYAELLRKLCGNSPVAICSLLGISSAVVDNVPLVQAAIDMFEDKPMDDPIWQLTALAAGTGGSILSVGSIAGVTLMSMEGVGYIWFVKNISIWALLGFAAGIVTYQIELVLFA